MLTFLLIAALHGGSIGPAIIMGSSSAYWLSDAKREAVLSQAIEPVERPHEGRG